MVEELLKQAVDKFNKKASCDEKMKEQLKDIDRKVLIEITNGPSYHFDLKECYITGFGQGMIENPDVRVITDVETLTGLLKKEIRPMKAYATGKLKIKASLTDLLTLKNFF